MSLENVNFNTENAPLNITGNKKAIARVNVSDGDKPRLPNNSSITSEAAVFQPASNVSKTMQIDMAVAANIQARNPDGVTFPAEVMIIDPGSKHRDKVGDETRVDAYISEDNDIDHNIEKATGLIKPPNPEAREIFKNVLSNSPETNQKIAQSSSQMGDLQA